MNWSTFQNAIFEAIENTNDSLLIEAVAGSGKSTTILEAVNRVPSSKSVLFVAFNKSIADSLKSKIKVKNARAMTLHAVGFAAWRKHLGYGVDCQVTTSKTMDIARTILDDRDRRQYGGTLSRFISIAKSSGVVPIKPKEVEVDGYEGLRGLVADEPDLWQEMIDFYRLEPDECSVEIAREVLLESINIGHGVIDYDDMLYLPVVSGVPFEKYDVVFLDEAQDVNSIQVEMVSRLIAPGGRLVAVGDRHQAIYGFRGSLAESMTYLGDRFHCQSLPLSVSYRCPRAIVRKAQEFVAHILSHESAPEGKVVEVSGYWSIHDFRSSDVILCRVSRPLISLAFDLIRNKIPCRVLGRDIGQGLVKLVRKMRVRDIPNLVVYLDRWLDKEIVRAKGDEDKIASARDRRETVQVFIDDMNIGAPNFHVEGLVQKIEALFSDDSSAGRITLSTVHKAKGLEFDRVFILDAHLYMPSPWARKEWQHEQEKNLQYVAITRSKNESYYLPSDLITHAHPNLDVKKEVPQEVLDEEFNYQSNFELPGGGGKDDLNNACMYGAMTLDVRSQPSGIR